MNTSNTPSERSPAFTAAFLLSVALNVGLIGSTLFLSLKDKTEGGVSEVALAKAPRHELTEEMVEVFARYLQMPMETLFEELRNTERVQGGYSKRDLALSCLVCFHNFHLEKALGGHPFEVRNYTYMHSEGGEQVVIPLFPEISSDNFLQILHFVQTERWPLTPKGLFLELKARKSDPSLKETFFLTHEFSRLYSVFRRSRLALDKEGCLELLLDGSWDHLVRLARYIDVHSPDSSVRKILNHLLDERSKLAARRYLEIDMDYILRAFRNEYLSVLIDLLEDADARSLRFLHALSEGVRPQYIKEKADNKLYRIAQQKAYQGAYRESTTEVSPEPKQRIYVVQPGDSLWKIAKKFKVSLQELLTKNGLERRSMITPGQKLTIPWSDRQGTGSSPPG